MRVLCCQGLAAWRGCWRGVACNHSGYACGWCGCWRGIARNHAGYARGWRGCWRGIASCTATLLHRRHYGRSASWTLGLKGLQHLPEGILVAQGAAGRELESLHSISMAATCIALRGLWAACRAQRKEECPMCWQALQLSDPAR